jgi:hypothetical protein
MSKVLTIIDSIRDTLNDPDGDRWSNDRLLRGFNEAISNINGLVKAIRGKTTVPLLGGINTYTLPSSVQRLTKALYNGQALEFKSHEEMDAIEALWEEDVGDTPQYIVYDKINNNQLRIYPTPNSEIVGLDTFGVITNLDDITVSPVFGVMTGIYEDLSGLVIYYIQRPPLVTSMAAECPLSDSWDTAIRHYVCAVTLRDDKDTQNRQFGNEEYQLYNNEIKTGYIANSKDYTAGNFYATDYRRL